jgi:ureidoacrylate peracid hydrolase
MNAPALLLIDMQVDFAAPDGAMAGLGKDMTAPRAALEKALILADAARKAGVPLVFVRLLTEPGGGARLPLCVKGTRGAGFVGPQPHAGDIVISKSRFSAFAGTDLAERLRDRGIDTVVLAGLTTECCIQASAWAAFELDFSVILASDACAAYEEDLHRHALRALELSGAIVATSAELIVFWTK